MDAALLKIKRMGRGIAYFAGRAPGPALKRNVETNGERERESAEGRETSNTPPAPSRGVGLAVQTRLDHLSPAVRSTAYPAGSDSGPNGQQGTPRLLGNEPSTGRGRAPSTFFSSPIPAVPLTQLLRDFKNHRETCAEARGAPRRDGASRRRHRGYLIVG